MGCGSSSAHVITVAPAGHEAPRLSEDQPLKPAVPVTQPAKSQTKEVPAAPAAAPKPKVSSPKDKPAAPRKTPVIAAIVHEGGQVFKPLQDSKESAFYEAAKEDPELKPLLPEYRGIVKRNDENHICLEDVFSKFKKPCYVDFKLGTRTWYDECTPQKKEEHLKEDSSCTTHTFGFRFGGMKVNDKSYDKRYGWNFFSDDEMLGGLRAFLGGARDLRGTASAFVAKLSEVLKWAQGKGGWELVASSVLLVYDAAIPGTEPTVRMIDFAHASHKNAMFHDDGYIKGLKSLIGFFQKLSSANSALDHSLKFEFVGPKTVEGSLAGAVFCDKGGQLAIIGGNRVRLFDMKITLWQTMSHCEATEKLIEGVQGHSIVSTSNSLLLYGGAANSAAPNLISIVAKPDSVSSDVFDTFGDGRPFTRGEHSAEVVGGAMFLFGGRKDSLIYGDLWRLDLANYKWQVKVSNLPSPCSRFAHSHASSATEMFIFGGEDSRGRLLDDVWAVSHGQGGVCDWRKIQPTGSGPSPRKSATMVYHQQSASIFLIGGFNGEWLRDVWSLNVENREWTAVKSNIAEVFKTADSASSVSAVMSGENIFLCSLGEKPFISLLRAHAS